MEHATSTPNLGDTLPKEGSSEFSLASLASMGRFSVPELTHRWLLARLSAFQSNLDVSGEKTAALELELLRCIETQDHDSTLRRVFDNSRKLGLSFARHLGLTLELSDLTWLLPEMKIPCFSGSWKIHNSSRVLSRGGCSALNQSSSFSCDFWREALDGFVMGVGDNERLARHRSMGHGDQECLDVLFAEEYTVPRVVSGLSQDQQVPNHRPRYGAIPAELSEQLEPTRKRLEASGVILDLEGLSEGVIYYQLTPKKGVLCGAGGKLLHDSFLKDLARIAPQIQAKDAAPLAVYGGSS